MEIKNLIKKNLKEIQSLTKDIEKEYKNTKHKQSILDKLIVDLEHEIEFDKMDAIDMSKKIKEMRAVLKLRRKYKNNMEYFTEIRKSINPMQVGKSLVSWDNIRIKQENKKYTHRVNEEVRNEGLDEIRIS